MPVNIKGELIYKEVLKDDIVKFTVKAPEIAKTAKQGQFLEIRVSDNTEPFLRRPISIYNVYKEIGNVEFVFQIKGKGTEILANKNEGDLIDIIGPLGYGTFNYEDYTNLSIIGGGIGIFPLHELAKNAKNDGKNINMYLGFRNKEYVILEEEYKKISDNFILTTDDGTYGKEGFAINYLKEDIEKNKPDCIFACGPLPMLKAVQKLSIVKNIPCQISLEEKMGCGLGACLGCAVQVAGTDENPEYVHLCKAGPVFEARDVKI